MPRGLFDAQIVNLVDEASRAPSALNAQPARWRFVADGSLLLFEDTTRSLGSLDATGRDSDIGLGAALEGMSIALSWLGLAFAEVEQPAVQAPVGGLRLRARCLIGETSTVDVLADAVRNRATWRGAMEPVDAMGRHALRVALDADDHAFVVADRDEIERAATVLQDAVARRLSAAATIDELRGWWRLAGDPARGRDGLDEEALGLAPAAAVPAVDMARRHLGDADVLRSASALVAITKPADGWNLDAGRVLYRAWLRLTGLGLRACPMSVLADEARVSTEIAERWGVPDGDEVVAVLRVGRAPMTARLSPRLAARELIV